MDILEITIWDGNGNVVTNEIIPAPTATPEQLTEMVSLIDNGCPAHLAARLVMMGVDNGED